MRNSKTFSRPISVLSALLLSLALVSPVQAADKPSVPSKRGTLEVQVRIPPTWQPIFEDRVTDAFVTHIADVFRQEGYKGDVKEVSFFDEPSPGCCLVTIDLIEWRMNMVGNIDCTFSASLQSGEKIRSLGIFSGMAFRWMNGPGRFGLSDTFGDAAEDAIRLLYRALERTDLVPGIAKK